MAGKRRQSTRAAPSGSSSRTAAAGAAKPRRGQEETPEPRRSVRATKGQHKALDALEAELPVRKRQYSKKKPAGKVSATAERRRKHDADEDEDDDDDDEDDDDDDDDGGDAEIIRCVCGASEQEEDSPEPWIGCDRCKAWQHIVCMGMSKFEEDLPEEYFCEKCEPGQHKKLLDAIKQGERPWETYRQKYEEQKRKKGGRKAKKRVSDAKDDRRVSGSKTTPGPVSSPVSTSAPPRVATAARASTPTPTPDTKSPIATPTKALPVTPAPPKTRARTPAPLPPPPPPQTPPPPPTQPPAPTPPPAPDMAAGPDVAAGPAGPGTAPVATRDETEPQEEDKPVEAKKTSKRKAKDQDKDLKAPVQKKAKLSDRSVLDDPQTSSHSQPQPQLQLQPHPQSPPQPPPHPHSLPPQAPAQDEKKVAYHQPADLATEISQLPDGRQGPANALLKSITHALGVAAKSGDFIPAPPLTLEVAAECMALQMERAIHDLDLGQQGYASQARTLTHNLKNNQELCSGLLRQTLSPPLLADMKPEQLASKQLQRDIQETKARLEKQATLAATDSPGLPGIAESDDDAMETETTAAPQPPPPSPPLPPPTTDENPSSTTRRLSLKAKEDNAKFSTPRNRPTPLEGTFQPPSDTPDFDLNKVLSSVKSPTISSPQARRMSRAGAVANHSTSGNANGPGVDPDIDRLLRDDLASGPVSPVGDDSDPDVVWRGIIFMNSIANFPAQLKYAGGANLYTAIGLGWDKLIPKRLHVAGRIQQQMAIEYLCGLRYHDHTDLVVTSLTPAPSAPSMEEYHRLINYFLGKDRYGVVGEKGVCNIRDTYVVPVPAGEGNLPEFMLNLADNFVPHYRPDPMLLIVFVYRSDGPQRAPHATAVETQSSPLTAGPTPTQINGSSFNANPFGRPSLPAPGSPWSGGYPLNLTAGPTSPLTHVNGGGLSTSQQILLQMQEMQATRTEEELQNDLLLCKQMAYEVLGPLSSAPTLQFLLPQALKMTRKEWEIVRKVLARDERSRSDLHHLSLLLEKEAAVEHSPEATGTASPTG